MMIDFIMYMSIGHIPLYTFVYSANVYFMVNQSIVVF